MAGTKKSKQTSTSNITAKALLTRYILAAGLLLAGVVIIYGLFILPSRPDNLLKKAFATTFDTDVNSSGTYDGSAGLDGEKVKVEFGGSLTANGDALHQTDIAHEGRNISLEYRKIGLDTYVKINGSDAMKPLLEDIPGSKPIDEAIFKLINQADGKWLKLTAGEMGLLGARVPCLFDPGLPAIREMSFDGEDFPFVITGGPYSSNDGGKTQIFEVGINSERQESSIEKSAAKFVKCLESQRDDHYTLREVNEDDVNRIQFSITVDPKTHMIQSITYKQFDNYFKLVLSDLNKDLEITSPQESITFQEFVGSLDMQLKAMLIGTTGAQ